MGFSLTATTAVISVTSLLILEILIGNILPMTLDIKDSYYEMRDRSIDQIQTDIEITEILSDTGEGQEWNNSVDSNSTDVDSSPDKGNETDFANAQDTSADSNVMTIQENLTGWWGGVDEWLSVASYTGDLQDWDARVNNGDATYLLAADDDMATHSGSYIHEENNANQEEGWFTFDDTSETGSGFTVNFTFRVASADADNDGFYVHYDTTGGAGIEGPLVAINSVDTYVYRTVELGGTFTDTQVNNMRIFLHTNNDGQGDDRWVDHCKMGINRTGSPNYEIDFEYNWTTANHSEDNEIVCIYVDSHTGSENLNVNYRNGGGWTLLGTISSTGWNNFTATGLDSEYYTIQFIGTSESSDSSQDSWDIDCIFLHNWNDTGGESLNITVKNIGSTILKTDDFDILLNGAIKSFSCTTPYIYLNGQANFSVISSIASEDIIKVLLQVKTLLK